MKIYAYKGCGTCQKAIKWLATKNLKYKLIPIREQPPTPEEIKIMMDKFGVKRLFNTSGGTYREMKIKDKLEEMTEEEIITLLASEGNLIKRPFVVDPYLIGFREEEWEKFIH